MKISKQARRDAKSLFQNCLVHGQLDENRVRETVRRVVELKPRGYLPILEHLTRLVKLEVERRSARIETAVPLTAQLQEQIKANLTRSYGPGLRYTFSQKPELVGGMRVQVGSDVFDGSVRERLDLLQESF